MGGITTINFLLTDHPKQTEDHTPIRLSAITNVSVQTNMPRLVWIQVQLTITITSNRTGELRCVLADLGTVVNFGNETEEQLLVGGGTTQIIEIKAHPSLFTLPGIYNLAILITLVGFPESYSESFEIVLGLGYTILFSLLIVFGTAVLVVLSRKHELDEEKIVTAQATQRAGRVPEGKIPCPTCHNVIDEGLAFCPECGERIPEFLRFTPGSSS